MTIPADEFSTTPFASVDVRVNVVDDDINENYQQYFLIGAEIADAVNASMIRNTRRSLTVGVILDDDSKLTSLNMK